MQKPNCFLLTRDMLKASKNRHHPINCYNRLMVQYSSLSTSASLSVLMQVHDDLWSIFLIDIQGCTAQVIEFAEVQLEYKHSVGMKRLERKTIHIFPPSRLRRSSDSMRLRRLWLLEIQTQQRNRPRGRHVASPQEFNYLFKELFSLTCCVHT